MSIPPLWFWIGGGILVTISIVLEIRTRRRMKKIEEKE